MVGIAHHEETLAVNIVLLMDGPLAASLTLANGLEQRGGAHATKAHG